MNTPQGAHAPGFLVALASIVHRDDISINLSGDAQRLTVVVAPPGMKPFKASGRPAALEAKLPAELEAYARWIDDQRAPDDEVEIDSPAGHAIVRPAAKKPAPKKAPARRPTKPAAPKKRAPAKKPTPKPAAPGDRAGKAECIADYRKLKAKHGAKLTRNLYVREAATGRRYEKLWANCWPDFVKEAERGTAPAAGAKAPKPTAPAKPAAPRASKPSAKATVDKTPKPWRVLTKAGKELGVTVFEKKVGDGYSCSAGTFAVVSIDAEKRELRVEPKRDDPPPPANPEKPAEDAAAASRRARGVYSFKTEAGVPVGGTVETYEVGEKWGTGERYEVTAIDHEQRVYTVRDRHAPAPAAATTEETPQ